MTNSNKKTTRHDLKKAPAFAHPEYAYWADVWEGFRAVFEGQRAVKNKGVEFLPQMNGQEENEYAEFLERATFYNMTGRTLGGLVGTIFKREPKVENLPKKLEKGVRRITRNGMSLTQFVKQICTETLGVGRYGALVDMDAKGEKAYFAGYLAENIIDWEVEEIAGEDVLTMVVLREFKQNREGVGYARRTFTEYRLLKLQNVGTDENPVFEYQQHRYLSHNETDADLTGTPDEIITPKNRGTTFKRIPFQFFGPYTNLPSAERPPLVDIYDLNISHYRSYAQLEHGRHYTALPVYYAPKSEGEKNAAAGPTYTIGPNVVWEVGQGEKPGIIEFNGTGLKTLETACSQKESQISALGGRMAGGGSRAVSESDNQAKIKEMNEQSLLLNVALSVDLGVSELLHIWAEWQDVKPAEAARISIELNTDFLFNELGAREFRAIHAMYRDGIIPADVLYEYLRKAELIPDWMSVEEFKKLLDNPDQFPNQNDVLARMRGYPDAKSEHQQKEKLYDQAREERMAKENPPEPAQPPKKPKPKNA